MKKLVLAHIVLFLLACSPELPDTDSVVQEIYAVKVEKLNQNKWNDCLDNIAKDAKNDLDSIVHRLMKADIMDTIDFPSRPVRPNSPDHIIGSVKRFEVETK